VLRSDASMYLFDFKILKHSSELVEYSPSVRETAVRFSLESYQRLENW